MSATVNFVIRDGLAGDIAECLLLDHTYETDTVWQMQVNDEGGLNISFKDQRLPRELVTEYSSSEARLRGALVPDQCFLVGDDPRLPTRSGSATSPCAAIRITATDWFRTSSSRALIAAIASPPAC